MRISSNKHAQRRENWSCARCPYIVSEHSISKSSARRAAKSTHSHYKFDKVARWIMQKPFEYLQAAQNMSNNGTYIFKNHTLNPSMCNSNALVIKCARPSSFSLSFSKSTPELYTVPSTGSSMIRRCLLNINEMCTASRNLREKRSEPWSQGAKDIYEMISKKIKKGEKRQLD